MTPGVIGTRIYSRQTTVPDVDAVCGAEAGHTDPTMCVPSARIDRAPCTSVMRAASVARARFSGSAVENFKPCSSGVGTTGSTQPDAQHYSMPSMS